MPYTEEDWIDFKIQRPTIGQEIIFIVDGKFGKYSGWVLGGYYEGNTFGPIAIIPGGDFTFKYWMPAPARPKM